MASVLLPTRVWGSACEQLSTQLGDDDELLVVCDSPSDPVASHDPPENVEILVAGEPSGCSGKANALACGLERAQYDRLVWTDDDFDHADDWLARMKAAGEEHGVFTEVPIFLGDGAWLLLEPAFLTLGSLGMYLAGKTWGGGVTFSRSDVDVGALIDDLRRTVSDDGLLSTRVDAAVDRTATEFVRVDGSVRSVRERLVRFVKVVNFSTAGNGSLSFGLLTLFAVGCLAFPLAGVALTTALAVVVYTFFDVRRPTALLAFPSFVLLPLFVLYGTVAPEFEWGGRRYRWRSMFDVTVVE